MIEVFGEIGRFEGEMGMGGIEGEGEEGNEEEFVEPM